MKTIVRIKKQIKNNRLLKPIYLRYRYLVNRCVNAESFKKLQNEGQTVIKFIQNTLENKIFFFFDCGTLLGIVREGRLLKHDDDIDIAVRAYGEEEIQKTRELFLKAGCSLIRSFSIESIGIVEDAFGIYDYQFDVFYIRNGKTKDYYYLMYKDSETQESEEKWKVLKLYFTPVTQVKKAELGGLSVNVPMNEKLYLQEKYGVNWRIPDKYFSYADADSSEKTDLIGICSIYV